MAEPLGDLYTTLSEPIFGFLLHLTGQPDLAEELTQETFLQALVSFPRFRGESSVVTWLYAIARNVYRKGMAREQRWRRGTELPAPSADPTDADDAQEAQVRLAFALSKLPAKYREALVLREYQDLSYAQVGQLLDETETWARVTCFRARRMLREAYIRDEGGTHQ